MFCHQQMGWVEFDTSIALRPPLAMGSKNLTNGLRALVCAESTSCDKASSAGKLLCKASTKTLRTNLTITNGLSSATLDVSQT